MLKNMGIKATGHVETDDRKIYDPETDKILSMEIKKTDDPKITLCMILKNEEDHIGRCLESIKGHVDEIVVVDTGSTDKTMDICREYGARIYEHPWENSFSKARNQAMGYVTTEWILQLDGDEEMEAESAPKIREVVRSAHNSTTNLCYLTLLNRALGSTTDLTTINTGKIIRMGIGAHYVNRIHNKLVCEGDTRITGLKIFHYGYHLSDEIMKAKGERTTRMLLEQLEEMPDDQETNYYLTIQYLRAEDWVKCIDSSEKTVSLFIEKEPDSQLLLLAYNLGAIAWYNKPAQNDDQKREFLTRAEELSLKALAIYPDYLDSNSLISSIYFATKEYQKCYDHSVRYLNAAEMLKKDPSKCLVIPLNTQKNEWLINIHLCINFYEQADREKAVLFLGRAEAALKPEEKYKASWTMFVYMIKRGGKESLDNAEKIYKAGWRQE